LEPESKGRSLIFDLAGVPWDSWDWGLHARHLLLHLFATLFNLGYQITASADVSSEFATDAQNVPISPLDVHSIFLVKMHTQPAAGTLPEVEEIVTEFGEHLGSGPPTYEEAMWPRVWVVDSTVICDRQPCNFETLPFDFKSQWTKCWKSQAFVIALSQVFNWDLEAWRSTKEFGHCQKFWLYSQWTYLPSSFFRQCRANSISLRIMTELSYFLLGPWEKEIQSKCFIVLIKKR